MGDEGAALKSNDNKKSSLRTLNLSSLTPLQVSINISQEDLLKKLNLNKETYRQAKKLASLPQEIQDAVETGKISAIKNKSKIVNMLKVLK